MLSYRMMDAGTLLPFCLHGRSVVLAELTAAAPVAIEREAGVPAGTLSRALHALAQAYGACGVLAVEGEQVIGKLRCYPLTLLEQWPSPCMQWADSVKALAALDLTALPARGSALHLRCAQVDTAWQGQGVGTGMLDVLIAWARAHGWQTLHSHAVQQIPPLLAWAGQYGVASLAKRGFTVTESSIDAGVRAGVVGMRQGAHGAEVRAQWTAFAHLSDDEAARAFEMTLAL